MMIKSKLAEAIFALLKGLDISTLSNECRVQWHDDSIITESVTKYFPLRFSITLMFNRYLISNFYNES